MTDELLKIAAQMIKTSNHLIALTGAGISKESNVPTFRGPDGLWNNYDAKELATPEAFRKNPTLVWEWYSWRQGLISACEPNPAHIILAKWEKSGLLKSLITQNVDGLHERAGSRVIHEVHGNLWAVKCTSCSYRNNLDSPANEVPICPKCSNILRPDVIWFGESLNREVMANIYKELQKADVCIVVGTSAIVHPAASFPIIVKQHHGLVIEVNVEATPLTSSVDYHIEGNAGDILPSIDSLIGSYR